MTRFKQILVFSVIALLLSHSAAWAGGDWSSVKVLKLTLLSDTDYILVVSPLKHNDQLTFGCDRFEVRGTFSRLDGVPWLLSWNYTGGPTKDSHEAALKYLKSAEVSKAAINFGYMGEGLRPIDPKNLCVVESRGLELLRDTDMTPPTLAVLSYFHEI